MGKKKNKFQRSGIKNVTTSSLSEQVEKNEAAISNKNITEIATEELDEKYQYVRKDVNKILFFLLIVIVLLVAAYFIENHTSSFKALGDWIYTKANISS